MPKVPKKILPRAALLAALTTMPEEAFTYLVLACTPVATAPGAKIWPDGIGGFQGASRASITAVREAADAYLKEAR